MKDPAALIYIDKYLIATAEMDADCVGWYTKLLMHQYNKKDLPSDIEALAGLCNVKFSHYDKFKQVFESCLSKKFELNENNRLENPFASEIISSREIFKDKRSKSGTIGWIVKMFYAEKLGKTYHLKLVKEYLYNLENEVLETLKDKQVLKQVLKQNAKLYINRDIDIDINLLKDKEEQKIKNLNDRSLQFKNEVNSFSAKYDQVMLERFYNHWAECDKQQKMRFEKQDTWELSKRLSTWCSRSKDFKPNKQTSNGRIEPSLSHYGPLK